MRVAILTGEAKKDPRGALCFGEERVKLLPDGFKRRLFQESEIQVLREPVIPEVAGLERRSSFEGEKLAKRSSRKSDEEPREAIVPFKDRFRDAAATRSV
jgi:hypothetical protein